MSNTQHKRRLKALERRAGRRALPLIIIHKDAAEPPQDAIARYWRERGETPPGKDVLAMYVLLNGPHQEG